MPSIPKPFAAPQVSLTRHEKSWQSTLPEKLSVGDNVMNFGIIQALEIADSVVRIEFAGNTETTEFVSSEPIQAFTLGD